jgi:hypothetical protein
LRRFVSLFSPTISMTRATEWYQKEGWATLWNVERRTSSVDRTFAFEGISSASTRNYETNLQTRWRDLTDRPSELCMNRYELKDEIDEILSASQYL